MVLPEANELTFLKGGGEMGELIRSKDWAGSPINGPDSWPQSLRTSISIILHSQFPMFIWWGPDLITIYNDAYRIIAGKKHPRALGESGPKVWSEIWDVVGPLAQRVMFEGASTWSEDQLLYINRRGYLEESYFTFSYSPVYNETGEVGGVFCACTETTAKVLAARKIAESERNLRRVILQAPVAMCILRGTSFVVEIANEFMFVLWGRGSGELINKPIFDGLPEAAHKGLEELLMRVYTTGETLSGNEQPITVARNSNAETIYVNFVYEPFREGDGTISGVMVVAIDVSSQVEARKKIEESREELQLALEIAELGTFEVALQSYKGSYSPRVRDWHGLKELENDMETIFSSMHPEDQLQVKEAIARSTESEGNSRHDIAYRVTDPVTGAERHLRLIGKALFSKGKAYQIRGIVQDVTAQIQHQQKIEESEAKLQQRVTERTLELENQKNLLDSILIHSSNGIAVTEMVRNERGDIIDAKTILANDAAVKFTGLPKEIYLSKTATELDPGILSSPYGLTCLKTLETGEPSISQYYLDITGRWLELTISKMDNDHLIHIFTDVTNAKEAQIQLERTIEDLQRSNASLEEFAFAASHDLKEPVRKVLIFANRLKEELSAKLNETQNRVFERMEHSAQRMQLLIDDLLVYSHINKDVSMLEEIDLNRKVQMVVEDLELKIQEKGAEIVVDPLPTIRGYRRQVQQLFQNLISNALKYNEPNVTPYIHIYSNMVKGKETTLNLSEEAKEKEFHLIQVVDNGIGFEQNYAEKIFNMFQRLHGKAEYEGTGIGLSIAKKVVQNHQGYIWAESEPGKGATFKVLLPVE